MSLRRRSLLFLLLVGGLLAASIAVIAVKPTVLGLDLRGGAQVVLEARATANAEVTPESMQRAIDVIRKRVDAFGVSEPEIQKQGTNQISVSLPDVEDPLVVQDLARAAQLRFYAFQPNLVDYQRYPAPTSTRNPPGGTENLYDLIRFANEGQPKPDAAKETNVYMFRKDAGHTYVAGPFRTKEDLLKSIKINPETRPAAAQYEETPGKFEFVNLKPGFVIVTNAEGAGLTDFPKCGEPGGRCVLLHNVIGLEGSDITGANLGFEQGTNKPTVEMRFSGKGQDKFAKITKELVQGSVSEGRPGSAGDSSKYWNFAIVLDGAIISNPYVSHDENPNGIDSQNAQISGGFTKNEAKTLADQLASGAIPVTLEPVSTSTVSATLGEQSLRQGLIASIAGLIVVALALIAYYRVLGVIAALSLVVYGVYFWALAKLVPIALTLPGIAGLILTIGVAADASVVIFERVREEARAGRPARTAVLNGYKRGITAIVDANIVTLVTAVFIFLLSTAGPRGFAFTLILGVLVSLFTAIIFTQGVFGLLVGSKLFENQRLMGLNVREIKWKMDVVGRWKLWLAISFIPMILGVFVIGIRGLEPGLDFKSGTEVRVAYAQQTTNENAIRDTANRLGYTNAIIQKFQSEDLDGKPLEGFEVRTDPLSSQQTSQLITELGKLGTISDQQVNTVGATFGRNIIRNAVYAIIFSFLAIIAYLTFRFEYKLALPALLSVVHDVWLALAVYSIAGKEVTGATVAALLTILGYSLYDVVILFDRIRENIPLMKGRPYRDIVNRSVHETLTRSIITMVTTLLPITCLLVFGGETLSDFSFALFVGILSGGVSSIFISAPVAALWKEREPDARKAAAKAARKAARSAAVDADIIDVSALRRAEAALAADGAPTVTADFVDEAVDDVSPNGRAMIDDIPPAVEDAGDVTGDETTGGRPEAPVEDAPKPPDAGTTAKPPPPERQRRHRNVQRKRRR
jgi:SecD/SecF fusion protein